MRPGGTTGQTATGAASQNRAGPGPGAGEGGTQARNPNVSSFPHAFERWEALSSHWEGLTSYWIRRLEQNKEDVNREPLAQQMSRQITDLSAAGANLFHAVVELQRLRASSERKFQRWFFETRAEQERAREVQAELEIRLRREQQERAELAQNAARLEAEKANADKLLAEMRRELQISKDEARRAWEELGRREQEERERIDLLKDGRSAVLGGIPVVSTGDVSRQGSVNRPSTRDGPFPSGAEPSSGRLGHEEAASPAVSGGGARSYLHVDDPFVDRTRRTNELYAHAQASDSPLPGNDRPPVTNGTASRLPEHAAGYAAGPQAAQRPPTSHGAAPSGSTAQAPFWHHQGASLQGPGYVTVLPPRDSRSAMSGASEEGTISEEDYELDQHGRPIISRRDPAAAGNSNSGAGATAAPTANAGDDYRYVQTQEGGYRLYDGHGNPVPPPDYVRGGGAGWGAGPADYSGAAYGMSWDGMTRHHHPTRLSDVQEEEDERSRTSMSRASVNSPR
jgi:hypothetical protein